MLEGPGFIQWSGGCEFRESLAITVVPDGAAAVARVVRRDGVARPSPPFVPVPAGALAEFLAELSRLLAAPVGPGDFSTSEDRVTIDLPLAAGRLRHDQRLADDGPPLDPIVAAIRRLADVLAPA
jgi:hypothetical protein